MRRTDAGARRGASAIGAAAGTIDRMSGTTSVLNWTAHRPDAKANRENSGSGVLKWTTVPLAATPDRLDDDPDVLNWTARSSSATPNR